MNKYRNYKITRYCTVERKWPSQTKTIQEIASNNKIYVSKKLLQQQKGNNPIQYWCGCECVCVCERLVPEFNPLWS